MTQILIVEDNSEYADDMAEFLKELDHDVTIARTASEMWAALTRTPAAVVVLDLGLPDEDGFNVIPRMRQLYPEIGLLVLTGRVAFDHRILGLRLGADHYLTKPIKFPELAAHLEALDRRVRPQEPVQAPSKWTLRVSARQLELMGKVIDLTEKECNFLHLLTINTRPVPRHVIVAGMPAKTRTPAAGSTCWSTACARKPAPASARTCPCAAPTVKATASPPASLLPNPLQSGSE